MIPNWYALLLLSLAAWRTFQLLSDDEIMDRPRRWLLRLGDDWKQQGDPVPRGYRVRTAAFLVCPYCFGFWIALAWYFSYLWTSDTLYVAAPLAISAGVVALARVLTPE